MKRTNVHLSDRQRERLERLAQYTGLKPAELVRRAIDQYLDQEEPKIPMQDKQQDR
jgi:predicted DNA-binding protein